MTGETYMKDTILVGKGREIVKVPRKQWEGHLAAVPEHMGRRLAFMTEQHHRIRYFVVRELPALNSPMTPEYISKSLEIPIGRVRTILEELERNRFFLVRDEQGAVSWAYPVTVDQTPHRLEFSTGELTFAA